MFLSEPRFQKPLVLKYHILNECGVKVYLRHEILLHYIENQMLAINYFFDISEKEKIEEYLQLANHKNMSKSENRIALISPREREVLNLVADGFSSKEIAEILFISNHTAISHRKNLIEKFHVKNTAQLIKRAALTMGLW
ncbi:response regulator transcription factor [Algibacter mikhailovii]|nr:helix-turn-helix transcriptional regulator [Algibacter mikhailovii]